MPLFPFSVQVLFCHCSMSLFNVTVLAPYKEKSETCMSELHVDTIMFVFPVLQKRSGHLQGRAQWRQRKGHICVRYFRPRYFLTVQKGSVTLFLSWTCYNVFCFFLSFFDLQCLTTSSMPSPRLLVSLISWLIYDIKQSSCAVQCEWQYVMNVTDWLVSGALWLCLSTSVHTWHYYAPPHASRVTHLWSGLTSPLYVHMNAYTTGTNWHNVFYTKKETRSKQLWICHGQHFMKFRKFLLNQNSQNFAIL